MAFREPAPNPALLRHLRSGREAPRMPPQVFRVIGPKLRKIRDPVENAIAAVETLERTNIGRAPRLPYSHRARYGAVAQDERPADYHGGISACCAKRVSEIQRMSANLELPYQFECPGCHVVYVIEMDMSEVLRG
jgi:hypothetical protein